MKRALILFTAAVLLVGCNRDSKIMPETIGLIPYPTEVEWGEGAFVLRPAAEIAIYGSDLIDEAEFVQRVIEEETGLRLPIVNGVVKRGVNISVGSDENDAYKLTVDAKGIKIDAANRRSVLLAAQTLRQLISVAGDKTVVAAVKIADAPRFEWRGMHMDVARHFFDKHEVMRFLDLMARYKFNKFHWHLTDDQAWRVEIKKYPRLTEVSAWRPFSRQDRQCMDLAAKEHNTDFLLPEDKIREVDGVQQYGGYYTQDDIREVVAYAASLGIDVMPEIDMPGHMTAAIAAYPEISCFNSKGWDKLFSWPVCPGKDATLEFCKDIYSEIFELFPYEYIDLGADEVGKDNWKRCPHCQRRIKQQGLKNEKELQSWFVREMEQFFIANGKKMVGWDEITEGGISPTATMMWWRTWAPKTVTAAMESGNEIILTPNSHYYFDYKQSDNTLRELYEFNPVPATVTADDIHLVKGVQANLWAEHIPSVRRQDYLAFPRMLALSETAWRADEAKQWDDFYGRLLTHFPVLDALGVNYRPLGLEGVYGVNVFVKETDILWEHPQTGIQLRYTTDGTIPDGESTLYEGPFRINETTDFTIRMFRPDGSAADIVRATYRMEEDYRKGEVVANVLPGLNCVWHEGIFNKCARIETVRAKQSWVVPDVVVPDDAGGKLGLVYTGYVEVPSDDVYTFRLGSDDGSMLYIGGQLVVDNDGAHGPVTLAGKAALGKGLHPLKLYYFDMNNGGFVKLQMFGPDNNEIALDEGALWH